MFIHFFKYQLKTLLRNKTVIFWTLVFPIILATLFNLAFSNLISSETFNTVKVAYVENKENLQFLQLLKSLENSDDKLIELVITNQNQATEMLENNEISGYYLVDDDIELIVEDTGIDETILESIANEHLSIQSTMTNLATINPEYFATQIMNDLDLSHNNFKSINFSDNTDATVIYFYTLIGMNCLNASFCGLRTTNQIEANLSRQGTRTTVSPISKVITVLSGIISAFLIQFVIMMVLMLYLIYGLKISFGHQVNYILLLIAVGCFTGVALGSLAGNLLKFKNEDYKIIFLTSFSLILSFFSGMMIMDIKYWIQTHLPLLSYLNPVNLITDGLYALYYYDNLNRYTINIICLLLIGIVLIIASLLVTRRKQYDSI